MKTSAFSATVCGRVQGVAFRYRAQEQAAKLSITGWVRNSSDGSVEIWAEGDTENLKGFLSWLKKGPPHASVNSVQFSWGSPLGTYKSFKIEYE